MKKLILFLLLSVFTLSVGYAVAPVETEINTEYQLSPTGDVSNVIFAVEGGINLTVQSSPNLTIYSNLDCINQYTNLSNLGTINKQYTKDLSTIKAKSKRNLKRANHIRLKRRLSDTGSQPK